MSLRHKRRGTPWPLLGSSGSGKSTLLHILGTLDRPTQRVGSSPRTAIPSRLPERDLADFRNRSIGFVFQDHFLLPQCSVLENVLIPVLAGPHDRSTAERWGRELIQRVGLSGRLDHRPAELSGGERQRVAIAPWLIRRPPPNAWPMSRPGNLDQTHWPRPVAEPVAGSAPAGEQHSNRRHPQRRAGEPVPGQAGNVRRTASLVRLPRPLLQLWVRNLVCHWRGNLAVLLGVAVGCGGLDRARSSGG